MRLKFLRTLDDEGVVSFAVKDGKRVLMKTRDRQVFPKSLNLKSSKDERGLKTSRSSALSTEVLMENHTAVETFTSGR